MTADESLGLLNQLLWNTIVIAAPVLITALAGLDLAPGALLAAAGSELILGILFAVILQAAFAAIYVAGRTIDLQAGFGLAVLIDPTSNASTPLIGTLLAMLAGMLFFAA